MYNHANTIRLAENLYSSDTRFVYEFIQNAEDATYEKAKKSDVREFISFNLYPGNLVIDSNEDGFSENDLRAICSTAQSSKVSQGYIGQKGIGFKSVFKIANKAKIQSGPFCFSFIHERNTDADGLGMITLINEPHEDLPSTVRTRITLTLSGDDSFRRRKDDLLNIPDTLLLFLNKLSEINVGIHTPNRTRSRFPTNSAWMTIARPL